MSFAIHTIDWIGEDTPVEDPSDVPAYVIKAFGKMADGTAASVTVTGFPPHFYVKLPPGCDDEAAIVRDFDAHLKTRVGQGYKACKVVKMKDLWGFRNGLKEPFVQLLFKNQASMRRGTYEFKNPLYLKFSGKSFRYKLYESNIEPYIRFFHKQNIHPSGWIKVEKGCKNTYPAYATTCPVDITASWTTVTGIPSDGVAPFRIAAFDIECTSFDGEFPIAVRDVAHHDQLRKDDRAMESVESWCGNMVISCVSDGASTPEALCSAIDERRKALKIRFKGDKAPDLQKLARGLDLGDLSVKALRSAAKHLLKVLPPLEGDPIIMIGLTINTYGEDSLEKHIYVAAGCADIPGATVHKYSGEREMLLGFAADLRRLDPDVLLGYNVFGFDMQYMYARSVDLGCETSFCKLGKIRARASPFLTKALSSSALGDNMLRYLHIHGRPCIDVMKVVQRDHQLASYKLDAVAEHFLGDKKHDVSPRDIFRLWGGDDEDRRVVSEYCLQDCALLNRLCSKLEILTNSLAMSNVCWITLDWIFKRGQSAKIFSLVTQQCKEDGFLVPALHYEANQAAGYEGAIVLTPTPAIYIENAIAVLDFASLYPSSMMSENISPETIVLQDAYANLPGVEYVDIAFDGEKCRFAQRPEGVLPRILKGLLGERKATRAKMLWERVSLRDGSELVGKVSEAPDGKLSVGEALVSPADVARRAPAHDAFQKAVLNGRQLAYKVTANSLYGQLGSRTSPIYMKELAACTTAVGRQMILKAKAFVEEQYGAEVIYGDSVSQGTPVIVRSRGRVAVVRIEELAGMHGGGAWRECIHTGKGSSELSEVEAWTDEGWSRIERVIRHQHDPKNPLVRVATGGSVVEVTNDHSLLLASKEPVKPWQLKGGEALLHAPCPKLTDVKGIDPELARMLGPFDIITPDMLNSSEAARRAIVGVRFGAARRTSTRDPLDASCLVLLAASLGSQVRVDWEHGLYSLKLTSEPYGDAHPRAARLMELPGYAGYVYDLTTENSRFQAGVGLMVVHNTDSLFVKVPKSGGRPLVEEAMEFGARASAEFNRIVRAPHNLEFDKVFWPLMIICKKRYAGNKYEDSAEEFSFTSMGICLRRRDSAAIVKTIYGGVMEIVLNKRDISLAAKFFTDSLGDLLAGRYPLEQLVITKSLAGSYADPERIAHKVLADRIAERDPGNKPQSSDRIPYVYVETNVPKGGKVLQGERIETPTYVLEHGLKPDYAFYVTNQIAKPVAQIFGIVVEQLPSYDRPNGYWGALREVLVSQGLEGDKLRDKIQTQREEEAIKLLVEPVLVANGGKAKRRRELVK